MKHLFHLLTLALCALMFCTFGASCAGVLTRDDAREIGALLAQESLSLASAHLAGQDVDLENAARALGIRVAGMATQRIAGNLQQSRQPTHVLDTALVTATQQMQQSVPDGQISQLASQIATDAVAQAKGESPPLPAGAGAKTAILVSP